MEALRRHRTILAPVALLALAALTSLGCGGGEDPRKVLGETFDSEHAISSGVVALELALTSEGGPQAGNASLRLRGPVEGRGTDAPALDMEMAIAADMGRRDFDFEGGLLSAGGKGFLRLDGDYYELPPRVFERLEAAFGGSVERRKAARRRAGVLDRLGIDPRGWLTDLSDEGTQRVNGEEVVVVSGTADVPRMVRDLSRASRSVEGATRALGADGLDDLERSVRSAEFTVYSGAEDRLLRRFAGELELRDPKRPGRAVEVGLDISIAEPNEPQRIAAPKVSVPLEGLLSRLGITVGELETALSGGSAGSRRSDGKASYRSCLRGAADANEVRDCAALLGA